MFPLWNNMKKKKKKSASKIVLHYFRLVHNGNQAKQNAVNFSLSLLEICSIASRAKASSLKIREPIYNFNNSLQETVSLKNSLFPNVVWMWHWFADNKITYLSGYERLTFHVKAYEIRFYINLCFKMATWNHRKKDPIFVCDCSCDLTQRLIKILLRFCSIDKTVEI